jgi:hypothetical protein
MQTVNEYKKLSVSESNGIRTFDDANIQKAVDRALSKLSPDKNFAVVAHLDYSQGSGGLSLTAVTKLGTDWSVAVACYKPATKSLSDVSLGAEVIWTP